MWIQTNAKLKRCGGKDGPVGSSKRGLGQDLHEEKIRIHFLLSGIQQSTESGTMN